MLKLVIEITGETVDDLVAALEQVSEKVPEGYTSGMDRNDTSRYHFNISTVE